MVYPPELAGERDCLNCDEPFTPAAKGWQALYCSHACWRANNGGPRHHQTADRPRPVAASSPPPAPPHPRPPAAPALVVVGLTVCPRCEIDHEVYGYRGAR